jgi:hypothetical protein
MDQFFGEATGGSSTARVPAGYLAAPRLTPKGIIKNTTPSATHPPIHEPMPASAALFCSDLDWMV